MLTTKKSQTGTYVIPIKQQPDHGFAVARYNRLTLAEADDRTKEALFALFKYSAERDGADCLLISDYPGSGLFEVAYADYAQDALQLHQLFDERGGVNWTIL